MRRRPQANKVDLRRRDFDSVGLQREAADLPANANVTVEAATRRRDKGAHRRDVFDRLLERNGYEHQAVRRLERDLATAAGEGDGPQGVRVDCSPGPLAIGVRQAEASDRTRAVLAITGARDARLLCELLRPSRPYTDGADGWRVITGLITGERDEKAQAARVRGASENLMLAWTTYDQRPRRAA